MKDFRTTTPWNQVNPGPKRGPWQPQEYVRAAIRSGSAIPFRALMVFSFILIVEPHNTFLKFLGPLRIALIAAAVAIISYVNDRMGRGQPISIYPREFKLAAVLAGLALLSIPFSKWPGGSFGYFFDVFLKSLIVFWLLGNSINSVTRFRLVAWALSLMAVPLAVTAVKNYLTGNFIGGSAALGIKRIVGYGANLTANPNDLALMLSEMLPFTVALYVASKNPRVRLLAVSIIMLEVAGVVVTFSRMGFLILATLFAVHQVKVFKRSILGVAMAMLVGGILAVPFLPSSYLDHMQTITNVDSDTTGSSQVRWADLNRSTALVLANPLIGGGIGMDELSVNAAAGKGIWKPVHNVYLKCGVELGIFGIIVFVMLLMAAIKSASYVAQRSERAPATKELAVYARAIQISLIAFAIGGFFSPSAYSFTFYYFAGLAVAVKATYWQMVERNNDGGKIIRA